MTLPFLYRIALAAATLSMLVMTPNSIAQKKTAERAAQGPRAIAVVQWQTDAQGRAVPRLLPVAILDEGRFYDASVYRATPVPMALEQGTVYEAKWQGETLGYFRVDSAVRSPKQSFVGLGEWEDAPNKEEFSLRDRPQTAEIVRGPVREQENIETGDDREELRRKKVTEYDEEGREIDPATAKKDPDAPTLKRGRKDPEPIDRRPTAAPPRSDAPGPTPEEDDPDRPRYKRSPDGRVTVEKKGEAGKGGGMPRKPGALERGIEDDPDRPVLKRGKPAEREAKGTVNGLGRPLSNRVVSTIAGDEETENKTFEVAAVSDANESPLNESYKYQLQPDEQKALAEKLNRLMQAELRIWLTARNLSAAPAKVQTTNAKGVRLKRLQYEPLVSTLSAYDLETDNSAELVVSATQALAVPKGAPGKNAYMVMVARVNLTGEPRKLFLSITADGRLDAQPRLKLIDAVDADGDGRAELLFRRWTAADAPDFILYKVGMDGLKPLFTGGAR